MAHRAQPLPDSVRIRRAQPEDAGRCGEVCYEAFRSINAAHNFPPDMQSPDVAVAILSHAFGDPNAYSVIAELDGRIAGSNCMTECDSIAGIGPITVDPGVQNRGIGRMLMEAVLKRAGERGFAGIRLVQAAFHNRSLSLYTSLGFEVREPLSVMQGRPLRKTIENCLVRPGTPDDLPECNRVCREVHGHDRAGELGTAVLRGGSLVVERFGRITGYATAMAFFGHAVGETNMDVQALIASAGSFAGPGILVPTRNTALFRWCLANGLRVVEPMTLMTIGLYNEPRGAWLPSILY